jgi:hypothetical protein
MGQGCRARVPDNCDFDRCGREVLREEFCKEHLAIEVRGAEREIKDAESAKRAATEKLHRLLGGRPSLGNYIEYTDPTTGELLYRPRDV